MTYVHLTLPKCIEHTIGSGKITEQMITHGKSNPGCMLRWSQFEQLMSCLLQINSIRDVIRSIRYKTNVSTLYSPCIPPNRAFEFAAMTNRAKFGCYPFRI